VVYNGDIRNVDSYRTLNTNYPGIQKWMIGRGIFHDPALPEEITTGIRPDKEILKKRMLSFLFDLYDEVEEQYRPDLTADKTKNFWKLFSQGFLEEEHVFRSISTCDSMQSIREQTQRILEEKELRFP
jgi:tRNA-dihydrouridine synthase